MKIIIQAGILMLFLVLTSAEDFCSTYISQYNRFRTECNLNTHSNNISSCCDLRVFQFGEGTSLSGVYTIRKGAFDRAQAFCDMNTADGGWIVIQRNRANSTVNFNRNYTEYEKGFGSLTGDFWYGLEGMQCLTQRNNYEMRIDYEYKNGTKSYLHYTYFRIDYAGTKYRIQYSGHQGVGKDYLYGHNSRGFSTADNDVDTSTINCAVREKSGFWYDYQNSNNLCGSIRINSQPPHLGVDLQFVEMKIRQKNCVN